MGELPVVISIDPPMSRDLDDAIAAVRLPDGGWRVDVCVPDVPALVATGDEVDVAARDRVVTRYGGPFVRASMLPEKTVAALSLSPRRNTPMCWFRIDLGADLAVAEVAVSRIVHRTAARLSYLEADEALADPAARHHAAIASMWELATVLHARRRLRTGAAFDPVRHVYTTEEGVVSHLRAKESHRTHLLVMEIMILANESLAAHARAAGVPVVYRNHRPRDASSGLRADVVREMREIDNMTPEQAAARLGQVAARIGPAGFGVAPEGHWGLDVPCYAWFTSPLRRYCDVVNLRALAHGEVDPDVAATATWLEKRTREIQEERSSDHGLRARAGIARQVGLGHAANLADRDLHTILRACSENAVIDDLVVDELRRRLAAGTVSGKDLESVFTYGRDVLDAPVVASVVAWLAADPQRQRALAHDMVLRQRIARIPSLPQGGEDVHAAMTRIAEILEFAWDQAPAAAQEEPQVDHPNPKGALLELATARGGRADFSEKGRTGPPHAPRFTISARWTRGEERLEASASASSVKAATRAAAWGLLRELDARQPPTRAPAASAADPSKPAKSRLLEHATASGGTAAFAQPVVTGPPHQPNFEVEAEYRIGDRLLVGRGRGRSRKEAEREAAEEVLRQVD
jgi:ribonuclease R